MAEREVKVRERKAQKKPLPKKGLQERERGWPNESRGREAAFLGGKKVGEGRRRSGDLAQREP